MDFFTSERKTEDKGVTTVHIESVHSEMKNCFCKSQEKKNQSKLMGEEKKSKLMRPNYRLSQGQERKSSDSLFHTFLKASI